MEVSIKDVGGTLPSNCHIGVRVGKVQKLAPYEPKTVYRFSEAKRYGKVDIYQRVGTCDLSWGCEDKETHTYNATGETGDTGIRAQVSMSRLKSSIVKNSELMDVTTAKSAKEAAAAKSVRYIQEQRVEVMLTAAMKELLKTMPGDAAGFISDFIAQNYAQKTIQKPLVITKGNFQTYYHNFVLPSCGEDYFASFHQRFSPKKLPSAGAAKEKSPEMFQVMANQADTVDQLRRQVEQLQSAAAKRQQSEDMWHARAVQAEAKNAELAAIIEKQRLMMQPGEPASPEAVLPPHPEKVLSKPHTRLQLASGSPEVHSKELVRKGINGAQGAWDCKPSVGTWTNPTPLPRRLLRNKA